MRVLWQATDETALGQVDQESFDAATDGSGPEFAITNTYDAASGVLDATTATAGAAGDTLTATYGWDGYNNLGSRSVSETVASGQTAPPALSETFTYDALNRLVTTGTSAGSYTNSETMSYNAVGGFLANGGYSGYQYDPSHPHELTSLTTAAGATRSFSYDANGNLLTESGDVNRSVTWTSYNKPAQIIGNGVTETFTYGPERSRLQTAITKGSDTVTTTYIDGLFEQVYDSATGNLTYRHYILAGGARVGVETIEANSSGTVTSDTLSFYVRDEVGSVVATVTENLGGANQSLSLASYGAWGKARATTGSTAYEELAPGSFYSPTPSGQEEGFAGHDNLEDTGLVDMEGRVYDPEVGTFLSPDPNVQYPFSSQGYDRYSYVGDNPLSLSDPSGYFSLSEAGIGQLISDAGPFLNAIPGCAYWCTAAAEAVGGYMQSGNNLGAGLEAGVLSFGESYAFTYVGDEVSWGSGATGLFEKSFTEGIIGGAFSEAGGGNFGDGFTGAFVSSELSPVIGSIGGNPNVNPAVYFSASNMAARAVVSFVAGGTVAEITGGNFGEAAFAAAMQSMFNDAMAHAKQQAALRKLFTADLANARLQVYLALIGESEGADYTTELGGEQLDSLATYPGVTSGRYQFEPGTWNLAVAALGLTDFYPESQDLAAVYLINRAGALGNVMSGNYAAAMQELAPTWASFPYFRSYTDYNRSYYPTLDNARPWNWELNHYLDLLMNYKLFP